jgi:hypothetical protein
VRSPIRLHVYITNAETPRICQSVVIYGVAPVEVFIDIVNEHVRILCLHK